MFLVVELLFIVLLTIVLFLFYTSPLSYGKSRLRSADVEECWTGRERREHVRFKKNLEVLYIERKRPQLRATGRTVDISMGGLKLLLDEKLQKGSVLFLKLFLVETKKAVEAEGEIVWLEEAGHSQTGGKRTFRAGVKFLAIKSPFDGHLLEYIRALPQALDA